MVSDTDVDNLVDSEEDSVINMDYSFPDAEVTELILLLSTTPKQMPTAMSTLATVGSTRSTFPMDLVSPMIQQAQKETQAQLCQQQVQMLCTR